MQEDFIQNDTFQIEEEQEEIVYTPAVISMGILMGIGVNN